MISDNKTIGKSFILDKRSDVYSYGIVLWEISSCRTPFPKEEPLELILKICNGLREKCVKGTPIQYIKIYTNCWQQEPDSRPLINEILSHLRSIPLEPVLEYSEGNSEEITTNYLEKHPDVSKNSISGIIMIKFFERKFC